VDESSMKVLLNHKVVELNYDSNEEKTTVTCENGKKFTADYVVINVPLGVLKKNTIKFTPKLPAKKLTAIERIGFGSMCKVLVVFKQYPVNTVSEYYFVTPENIKDRGLFTYFHSLLYVSGVRAFVTYGMANSAEQAETMP
jgi:protoporphyrinogen oxidase